VRQRLGHCRPKSPCAPQQPPSSIRHRCTCRRSRSRPRPSRARSSLSPNSPRRAATRSRPHPSSRSRVGLGARSRSRRVRLPHLRRLLADLLRRQPRCDTQHPPNPVRLHAKSLSGPPSSPGPAILCPPGSTEPHCPPATSEDKVGETGIAPTRHPPREIEVRN
jgi:hypothetical protein